MTTKPDKYYRCDQVLKASAIYAVYYDGEPINLKSIHTLLDESPKYKKTSFANVGHAKNLARKLNEAFKTDKYEVFKLTKGEKIE